MKTHQHFTLIEIEDHPVIHITSGRIRGHVINNAASKSNEIYYSFQGIPYAQPPVGELRFKPPVKPESWTNIRNATNEANMCMQLEGGSEDCLYLSVFTPKLPNQNSTKIPVMVYIHGGAFNFGSPNTEQRSPDYFMESKDNSIVLVTIQYRLNVFGFLSTGNTHAEGNIGLKDQVAALIWVKENIDNFGGDSQKVTIFGESSGAVSVQYLMISPLAKGLFHRAISQSGSVLNRWAIQRTPRVIAFKLGLTLGIVANNSKSLVEQLRKIEPTILVNAACPINAYDPLKTISFRPSLEIPHPGAFFSYSCYEALEVGNYAKNIPYLAGYNKNEANVVMDFADNVSFLRFLINVNPSITIPESLNLKPKSKSIKLVEKELKRHYFSNHTTFMASLVNFLSEEFFIRGIRKSIDLMRNHSEVYIYKFEYDSNNENDLYMGHSAELNYLFFNKSNIQTLSNHEDLLTEKRVIKLWTNFAIYGNPTPKRESILNHVEWKKVPPGDADVPFLLIKNQLEVVYNEDQESYSYWEKLFQKYGIPPYLTW